ncbi:MAG: hypothetical protein HZC14_00755 [Candidatus Niyogibacteria bacterium]|nr:hypothetical protein [Candidatus Niyogibacteria bacterium]
MDDLIQNQNLTEKERDLLFDFLLHLPYDIRQSVKGIISAHPKHLRDFLPILNKKKEFMGHPTPTLAEEILRLEKNVIGKLLP